MAQKERLKREIRRVFHSNLIYLISGSGFFLIFIIGIIFGFAPFTLLITSILGGVFFYIFSIIIVTQILAYAEKEDKNHQMRVERSAYRFALLYWLLKSKNKGDGMLRFKEESAKNLGIFKSEEYKREVREDEQRKIREEEESLNLI